MNSQSQETGHAPQVAERAGAIKAPARGFVGDFCVAPRDLYSPRALRVTSIMGYPHKRIPPLVSLAMGGGSLHFQHDMTAAQARELAALLLEHAAYAETGPMRDYTPPPEVDL